MYQTVSFPLFSGKFPIVGVPIRNIADYSPFGVQLDGRTVQNDFYRRSFNGMEKDDEVKGGGNSYDFGARMYDSRVGRWLSGDPQFSDYPSISGFCFAINNPNRFIDPNGKWVVEIQKNAQGKYELIFIAQENDNLQTLSLQLGLSEETILKAHPEISNLAITNSTKLKLENIKQVQNINTGINYIGANQSFTNCANLADHCDGGTAYLDKAVNNSDDGVRNYSSKLANLYVRNEDVKAQIGDVLVYETGADFIKAYRQNIIDVYTERFEGDQALIDYFVNKHNEFWTDERIIREYGDTHFSILILKDKTGTKPAQIIQKNGLSEFDFKVDDSSDLTVPQKKSYPLIYERTEPEKCKGFSVEPGAYRNPENQ